MRVHRKRQDALKDLENVTKIKNPCERKVAEIYTKMGYKYLKKGWPDFLFVKENPFEVVFVEVKKKPMSKVPRSIKYHQETLLEILKRLGLNVRVEFIPQERGKRKPLKEGYEG